MRPLLDVVWQAKPRSDVAARLLLLLSGRPCTDRGHRSAAQSAVANERFGVLSLEFAHKIVCKTTLLLVEDEEPLVSIAGTKNNRTVHDETCS